MIPNFQLSPAPEQRLFRLEYFSPIPLQLMRLVIVVTSEPMALRTEHYHLGLRLIHPHARFPEPIPPRDPSPTAPWHVSLQVMTRRQVHYSGRASWFCITPTAQARPHSTSKCSLLQAQLLHRHSHRLRLRHPRLHLPFG